MTKQGGHMHFSAASPCTQPQAAAHQWPRQDLSSWQVAVPLITRQKALELGGTVPLSVSCYGYAASHMDGASLCV